MPKANTTSRKKPTVPPHAGAAAIYGFLFQLTVSLYRVTRLVVADDPEQTKTVIALFEPRGGGDLDLANGAERRAIQFKQRQKALTVTDLTASVLPDLFRAHLTSPADIYELQATKPLGKPAQKLVQQLTAPDPDDNKTAANLTTARARCREVYFKRLGTCTGFDEAYAEFVSAFKVGEVLIPKKVEAEVKAWLLQRIPYAEEVDAKFDEVVGALMVLSTVNDAAFTLEDLLRLVGTRGLEDMSPANHDSRLASRLANDLSDRNYRVEFDIRDPVSLDDGAPMTLVGGASGHGKSWRLYRTAAGLSAAGVPVVLIRAETKSELKELFERLIRGEALGFDASLPSDRVGATWRRIRARPDETIVLFWEGCRDFSLITEVDRERPFGEGVHIVAELPADVVPDHPRLAGKPSHFVGLFSHLDVFKALDRHGVSAGQVPPAILEMLYLPVLCGVYASLAAGSGGWQPTNEYLVLERFWEEGCEAGGTFTEVCMTRLAMCMVDKRSTSVSEAELLDCGFKEEKAAALISAGWLQKTGRRWSFSHDRYLTWAVGVAMAQQFTAASGSTSAADAVEKLRELTRRAAKDSAFPGLSFLLMDFIWQVAKSEAALNKLVELITLLERDPDYRSKVLYEMLATAGDSLLPAILSRAKGLGSTVRPGTTDAIAEALASMGLTPGKMAAIQSDLWRHDGERAKDIALELGAKWPLTEVRDDIWDQYLALSHDRNDQNFARYLELQSALVVIARADPSWLESRLSQASSSHDLYFGVQILCELDQAVAQPIWEGLRDKLFGTIEPKNQHALCRLAADLGDMTAVPKLETLLATGNMIGGWDLRALCLLAPERALELLEKPATLTEAPGGRDWLDALLDHDEDRARWVVHSWLLRQDPSGAELAEVWRQAPERADARAVDALLQALDKALEAHQDAEHHQVRPFLSFLASRRVDPDRLSQFAGYRGTALEARLAGLCKAGIEGEGGRIPAWERLLRRMGGPQYEALALDLLASNDERLLAAGVTMSRFGPSPDVVAHLEDAHVRIRDMPLSDDVWIKLWFALEACDTPGWPQRLRRLLASDIDREVCLGLTLLGKIDPEPYAHDLAAVLARSAPGSLIEGLALARMPRVRPGDALARERAAARLDDDGDNAGSLDVLLNDDSPEARAILDPYLLRVVERNSWPITQLEAIRIRLQDGEAPEALWNFAAKSLGHPALFGGDMTGPFVKHRPEAVVPELLVRAFSVPSVVTNDQPSVIRYLNSLHPDMAVEAFTKSWVDHPQRREHLLDAAASLGDRAVDVLVRTLFEFFEPDLEGALFRRVGLKLRARGDVALEALRQRYGGLDDKARMAILGAISWVSDEPEDVLRPSACDPAPAVRRYGQDLCRRMKARTAAVERFRQGPSSERLSHLLIEADPSMVLSISDRLSVRDVLDQLPELILIAETEAACRWKELTKYNSWRAPLR